MKNFKIEYIDHNIYNELKYVRVNNVSYMPSSLSQELVSLLTILSYVEESHYNDVDLYNDISLSVLGFNSIIKALNELKNMGCELISTTDLLKYN